MTKGTIFNIQKFSLHDGPGIRTTVFLKGCPLKCWWCHNPESQSLKHEVMFFQERCTGCGVCAIRCTCNAIEIKSMNPVTEKANCSLCGKCSDFCPNNAREYVGKDIVAQDLMKEIIKDEIFYEESNGGVTFSGGEPMLQVEFLSEVLKACKHRGIHTAVDTSGYVAFEKFNKVINDVDLFLYDLKLMNKEKHIRYIGAENDLILENLKKLSERGSNIFVRMPIIAGINDDDENIDAAVKFLSKLNIIQVNLLPYHNMGMDKYRRLMMDYKLSGIEKPTEKKMEEIVYKFKRSGVNVKIGG